MFSVSLAFIDGLGAPEMVLIFVLVLVLFGGQKLPEFARGLGKSIREFKKAAAGVEEEFKRALEEDERKHTTPQLTAPAPEPVPASTPVSDAAGPSEAPPPPSTESTPEPTIMPPAEPGDPKSATPPKPTPPPPAIQYPENPS